MICDMCMFNEAVMHIQMRVENEKMNVYLCQECAEAQGILVDGIPNMPDPEFLDEILQLKGADLYGKKLSCPHCGMNVRELLENERLGCLHCVNYFPEIIDNKLAESESANYNGKMPERTKYIKRVMLDGSHLKWQLEQAEKREDYEQAARLRDQLAAINSAWAKEGS